MSSSKIENLVQQSFDKLYRQRITKLTEVTLSDLLHKQNLYLLCATCSSSVSKIAEKMLEAYITSTDESFFGVDFFESIARIDSEGIISPGKKSNSIYKAISLIDRIRTHPTQNSLEFMDASAKTLNSLEQELLINFGNPDGSINWEKLLRYNSGIDKVLWVSKVIPVISTEDQEDESNDDDTSYVDDDIEDYA